MKAIKWPKHVVKNINLFSLYRNCVVGTYSKNTFFLMLKNSNTVSQHNTDETKEIPQADSDEPCEMKEDSVEEATEGTDEEDPLGEPPEDADQEDPLGESTGGANEEDMKVGKIVKLTACINCFIAAIDSRVVLATCFILVSCLAYSLNPKMEVACSSETCILIFNGLHGIISQKIELHITIAVRTSDPKYFICVSFHKDFTSS
jgi:hypothetical protein